MKKLTNLVLISLITVTALSAKSPEEKKQAHKKEITKQNHNSGEPLEKGALLFVDAQLELDPQKATDPTPSQDLSIIYTGMQLLKTKLIKLQAEIRSTTSIIMWQESVSEVVQHKNDFYRIGIKVPKSIDVPRTELTDLVITDADKFNFFIYRYDSDLNKTARVTFEIKPDYMQRGPDSAILKFRFEENIPDHGIARGRFQMEFAKPILE